MQDKCIDVIGIINGIDVIARMKPHQTIHDLTVFVCTESNNVARPFEEWIVYTDCAEELPPSLKISHIEDGTRLFFNLGLSKEQKWQRAADKVRDEIATCALLVSKELGIIPTFGGTDLDKRIYDLWTLVKKYEALLAELPAL